MKLYRLLTFGLSLLFVLATAARGGFYVEAGPTFSRVDLLRGHASTNGFAGSLGYNWRYFGVEAGYADLGKATENFYGETIGYIGDDIVADSLIHFGAKAGYAIATLRSRPWHGTSFDVGIGITRVDTRATSGAFFRSTGQPVFDHSYSTNTPYYRMSVSYGISSAVSLRLQASYLQARALPRGDGSFGGGKAEIWTLQPSIRYEF